MTVSNPPIFLQSELHPAEDVRRWISSSVGGVPGVDSQESLRVTPNGTPNMTVVVAAGGAYIQGSENLYQGMYFTDNRGAESVTVQVADPTNDRIDFIVIHVKDSEYSGSDNEVIIESITGTPAPIPVAPALPENSLLLARVAVNANATVITSSMLTDERTFIEVASKGYVDGLLPVGMIVDFGGPTAPTNWLMCDGTIYSRSQHPALFNVIGTRYNTGGESSVQFRLPDYTNRVAIGPGDYALGAVGGAKDAALPSHNHTMGTHEHAVDNHAHTMPEHKHTMGTHKHTMGTHQHTVDNHAHTMPSHTHTTGSHSHTMSQHAHSVNEHDHSINEHQHTADHEHGSIWSDEPYWNPDNANITLVAGFGTGALGFGLNGQYANVVLNLLNSTDLLSNNYGTHSHRTTIPNLRVNTSKVSLTTNKTALSTNSAGQTATGSTTAGTTGSTDPGDTNSKTGHKTNSVDPGDTGYVDPGDTNNADPGDTNAKTGLKTNRVDPGDTSTNGVTPNGLNYPPFQVSNKIIKAV